MTEDYQYLLIVDDQQNVCRLFFEVFTDEGFNVELAYNAEQAINKIRSRIPMLILLDVNMPGMSGIDTLREIRKLAPDLPVVMMTAYSELEVVLEARKKGTIQYYLSKPFDLSEVSAMVKEILAGESKKKRRHILQQL